MPRTGIDDVGDFVSLGKFQTFNFSIGQLFQNVAIKVLKQFDSKPIC